MHVTGNPATRRLWLLTPFCACVCHGSSSLCEKANSWSKSLHEFFPRTDAELVYLQWRIQGGFESFDRTPLSAQDSTISLCTMGNSRLDRTPLPQKKNILTYECFWVISVPSNATDDLEHSVFDRKWARALRAFIVKEPPFIESWIRFWLAATNASSVL